MSVFAENIAVANQEAPKDFLSGRWAEWHLAAVLAGHMREHGQRVYPDPGNQDADDKFESHAAVAGPKQEHIRKKLGERYEWVIPPSQQPPAR